MEKQIRRATDFLAAGVVIEDEELTELTKCAVEISRIAMVGLSGELRVKALNIATAIADYEDELEGYADKSKQ